ncbi:MAG TPA: glycosyltransferase family 4 protein [Candidatus Limnocylindrales bacterium]|nr:glycosyltransferase family 4 protein [Candidatus Limnocylindrales bacterium]
MTPASKPVAQRATLVLPSSGAFDSRAWRIASSLAARGHEVTVLARSEPGLPDREDHAAGYRVIRVPVSTEAGLPRPLRPVARRMRRRVPPGPPADGETAVSSRPPSRRGVLGRIRAGFAAAWRLAAIALTVRSQRLATRPVAPMADLVHAMAYMGIPIGLDLGRRDLAPVVYDARDIYIHARNIARLPLLARRLFGAVERRWARQASRVMTVNRPYAEVLAKSFGTPLPAIVMNCSYRRDPPAERPRRFHEALALSKTARVVLYQGGLAPHRGIEELIAALDQLAGNIHLCLLGYGPLEAAYREAARRDVHRGRLHVLPAVPPAELLDWVASADIVAMPIQPTTLNHRLTTPNKLFEAMAAGVPVIASDLPGMAPIVRETGCGVVCDPTDPAAIADAIRSIFALSAEERDAISGRALAAAAGPYSWEAQVQVLLDEYGRLTGRPW